MESIVKEKVAFEGEKRGYYFKATYLTEPQGKALIEIFKGNKIVKEFLFPSYKIWNITAHSNSIIDSIENNNENGFIMATSNGLDGLD